MDVLLFALSFQMLAGIAALVVSKWPRAATILGAGGAALGCLVGLVPTLRVLLGGPAEAIRLAWDAAHGPFCVELDALGAFFLLPVLGLSALAAVYGADYLYAFRKEKSLGGPWFFFNVFIAGMGMVVVARTAVLFLIAWEVMSLAAYFLVTFEHEQAAVRQAGWVYLIATHLGAAFLVLAFVFLGRNAGSLEFEAFRAMPALAADAAGLIFVLALVGFGAKAGFVPFHVWLPEAHPAAPSHVSALMSGVMIKMGLYGILRIVTFLGPPAPWWGLTLAGLGLFTALVGIALALYQRDVKRVLAYSSIENMGLIGLALGVGLWGWARHHPVVAVLGMTAGLLHVWNHALMKGLMFFAAGSVLHATGTRDMEKLGGLLKRMPWTGSIMIVGAVALAALPPLNGFVSKWLLYLSLLQGSFATNDSRSLTALFAVGLLALVGGLAVVAFVRLTGIVLLGSPRSEAAGHAHEASPWLLGPMLVLLLLCLTAALVPQAVVNLLAAPLTQVLRAPAASALGELGAREAPLYLIGNLNGWILVALGGTAWILLARSRKVMCAEGPTWGCGYIRPTARMQYTGRSFAEMIAEHLLPRFLRPHTTRQAPRGLFPTTGDFGSECPDPVQVKVYEPFFRRWANGCARLRILQQGQVHVYLLYVLLVVVLSLVWMSVRVVGDDMMETTLHHVIHVLLALTLPPLLLGVIARTKALFAGRVGPPLLQPYYDLIKLFQKGAVFSTTTTWVFRAGPVVGVVTAVLAVLLIPLANAVAPISFTGDLILLAYLLGLGRFFTALAALDTGSAFEGMGAAREVTFACLAEPAFFLGLLVLARLSGSLQLAAMLGSSLAAHWPTAGAALALVLLSWFVILLAENARIPFDDPNTHLELTMIHEVMVLDHSGPAYGMILYGAALKLFVFGALVVRLAVPLDTGLPWLDWPAFVGSMLGVAVAIGVVESTMARLRMTHIPILLVAACLLSAFGVILAVR